MGTKYSRLVIMYEDFHVIDHWTQEDLHCRWTANVVAIATRHACGHLLEVERTCRHCGGPVTRDTVQAVRPGAPAS